MSNKRPVFHSEADFQFSLAWQIQQTYPHAEIRLEWPFGERSSLDIWISAPEKVALELKYFTAGLAADVHGERFMLVNRAAHLISRYDAVKDLTRLEQLAGGTVAKGALIVLTNDPAYWKPPARETMDSAFRIHEDRLLHGELTWAEGTGGTTKGREEILKILSSYTLHWRDYSDIAASARGQFRYLLVEVALNRVRQ